MNDSPENFLRIVIDNADIREFELPATMQGEQTNVTARKRGEQFVDAQLHRAKFNFDHPVMQRMLADLEQPEKGDFDTIVQKALAELHQAISTTITQ